MRYRYTLKLLLVVCIALLFACTQSDKITIAPESVVLAFGDSLTQGVGAQKHQSYPVALESLLGVSVINSGISGQTSEQGLARLNLALKTHQPELIILCYGGNDILRKKSKVALKQNLAKMIELAHQHGVQVLLIGVPSPGLLLSPLSLYEELSEEYQVIAELEVLSDLLSSPSKKSDAVHLNALGYSEFASAIADKIRVE